MLAPDVNVLIHAFDAESRFHERARSWLENVIASDSKLGLSELALSTVVRIMSRKRIAGLAYDPLDVLSLCDDLLRQEAVVPLRPGPLNWSIFETLVRRIGAHGNLVPDCYHAALAIENEATWVSGDEFFGRVPGLDWFNPFA